MKLLEDDSNPFRQPFPNSRVSLCTCRRHTKMPQSSSFLPCVFPAMLLTSRYVALTSLAYHSR